MVDFPACGCAKKKAAYGVIRVHPENQWVRNFNRWSGRMRISLWGLALLGVALFSVQTINAESKPLKNAAKAKPQYIPVKVFKNTAEAQGFLELAKRKQIADEDASVLARLLLEKEAEIKELEQQLLTDFGVQSTVEYEYDSEKKIIFAKKTDAAGGVLREPLREFRTPESEQDFLKLVTAKRMTVTAISTLKLLVMEKDKEKELVDQRLAKTYDVLAAKNYYYDAAKTTLFEVQDNP
jgi:hypothetical protein